MKKLLLAVLLGAPCWAQEGYSPTAPFPVPVVYHGTASASSNCPDPRSSYYYGPGSGYYYNYRGYAVGGGNSNPNFPGSRGVQGGRAQRPPGSDLTRTTSGRTTGKDLLPGYQTERGAWRR